MRRPSLIPPNPFLARKNFGLLIRHRSHSLPQPDRLSKPSVEETTLSLRAGLERVSDDCVENKNKPSYPAEAPVAKVRGVRFALTLTAVRMQTDALKKIWAFSVTIWEIGDDVPPPIPASMIPPGKPPKCP